MNQEEIRNKIGSILVSDREKIGFSFHLDEKVNHDSIRIKPLPVVPVMPVIVLAFVLVVSGMFFLADRHGTDQAINRECRAVFSEMADAISKKDVNRSVSFFDAKSMGIDEKVLKQNVSDMYGRYESLRYEVSDVVVKPGPKGAVAQSRFFFTARSLDGRTTTSFGHDRIWFAKTPAGLKIICRVIEEGKKI